MGGALAYLIANVPAVIAAVDPTFSVFDCWPDNPEATRQFCIGRTHPNQGESQAQGTAARITIGGGTVAEEFGIPCFILVTSTGTSQVAQAAVRGAALAAYNAFMTWLVADPTLGGNITSGFGAITGFQLEGTPADYTGMGRSALVTFTLLAKSQYDPTA